MKMKDLRELTKEELVIKHDQLLSDLFGMRIKHAIWGEGIILNARLQDGDETVDAVFESVGIKRMVASLAKLEIIGSETRNG